VDIVTAHLNAQVHDKKLYMRPPTGYDKKDNKAYLLLQVLYGLRQSVSLWNKVLDKKLKSMGFVPLIEHPCVYSYMSFTIIYVDKILVQNCMANCYPNKIPMSSRYLKDNDDMPTDNSHYLRLIGQFNWLAAN
jgi:hypothetical protein